MNLAGSHHTKVLAYTGISTFLRNTIWSLCFQFQSEYNGLQGWRGDSAAQELGCPSELASHSLFLGCHWARDSVFVIALAYWLVLCFEAGTATVLKRAIIV